MVLASQLNVDDEFVRDNVIYRVKYVRDDMVTLGRFIVYANEFSCLSFEADEEIVLTSTGDVNRPAYRSHRLIEK